MNEKMFTISKNLIAGILHGLVIGALLYLIAIGLNGVLLIWAAGTEVVFFIIGFAAGVGTAYVEEEKEKK